jgi:serine/threonine-protein kinase
MERHELIGSLGASGATMVALARAPRPPHEVFALRLFDHRYLEDPEFAERFFTWARRLAQLELPGLAKLEGFGRTDRLHTMIYGFVHGANLTQIVLASMQRGGVSVRLLLHTAIETCHVLEAAAAWPGPDARPLGAHGAALAHGSIAPSNLMVGFDGDVHVTDLGLSMIIGWDRPVGSPPRSLAYVAPERLAGAPPSPSADVFSLGATLWECVLGRALFRGASREELAEAITKKPITPPSRVDARLAFLDAPLMGALERDPTRRFAGPRELRHALEAAAEQRGGLPPRARIATIMRTLFDDPAIRLHFNVDSAARSTLNPCDLFRGVEHQQVGERRVSVLVDAGAVAPLHVPKRDLESESAAPWSARPAPRTEVWTVPQPSTPPPEAAPATLRDAPARALRRWTRALVVVASVLLAMALALTALRLAG